MQINETGIAASGHPDTSRAAVEILEQGGNAFDAALAALCAACMSEPLLASLAGGGFMLAHKKDNQQCLYDFFCQTPARRRDEQDIEFFPFLADFGADEQEFHIGMGSMAVPGVVAGLFAVHEDLCSLPLQEIIAPACALARRGVVINERQAYIIRTLAPMLQSTPEAVSLYQSAGGNGKLLVDGDRQYHPQQADALEAIVAEGPALFYQGDWASHIMADCAALGGQLTRDDLARYTVRRRRPVSFHYRDACCAINALPSQGGALVAFALGLRSRRPCDVGTVWGEPGHLLAVLEDMDAANRARRQLSAGDRLQSSMLDEATLDAWSRAVQQPQFSRGTTHISVADSAGNLASLTVSNGEGCGYMIPGTGIMMNNMLGEQDINPSGFHRWRPDSRLASMMSPAVVVHDDGRRLALGTGGSNRIRSAMLQVLINLLDFRDPLDIAVKRPRIHLEGDKLSVEGGFAGPTVEALRRAAVHTHVWPESNMFFGGVNAVELQADGHFFGASDPRREGSVMTAPG